MVAKRENTIKQFGIIGHKHAPFASGNGFGSMEGKGPEFAHRPSAVTQPHRADRFSGVFNNRYAPSFPNIEKTVHVTQVAVEVCCQNCFGLRGDCCLDLYWVDTPSIFLDIDKNWLRSKMNNRCSCRYPIGVCHNYFIAVAYTECCQSHVQGACTA